MKTEQTNTSDPQLRQQFGAKSKRFDEACNDNDAAAIAAFFTEDAVLVTETGIGLWSESNRKIVCRPVPEMACQPPYQKARSVFPSHYRYSWQ
jgi:hypothetical protein